jgi:hypothetical protein
MRDQKIITHFTLFFLFFGFLLMGIHSAFAVEVNDITQRLSRTIVVNPDDPKANLSVDELINQITKPQKCKESDRDTFCRVKSMKVNFEIEYVTERVSFADINDADAWEYGRYYPDEPLEVNLVRRNDTEAITLIQKALKERGLLGPTPTGILGNKTISALMDLAWLKGKSEKVFKDLNRFRVTKDMLHEILGLKRRMAADPFYVQNNPLPPINWQPGDVGQSEKANQKNLIRLATRNYSGAGIPQFNLGSVGEAKATGNVDVEIQR